MLIRLATKRDSDPIWTIIGPTIRAGEPYALDRDLSRADALAYWMGVIAKPLLPRRTVTSSAPIISAQTRRAVGGTSAIAAT